MAGKSGALVLVAEDDSTTAAMLADLLRHWGYGVECVASAAEAEARAAEQCPDLVILDLKLPDGNGLVLCANLKARCDVPVIVCSATQRLDDAVLALKLGADDFVPKPFRPAELQARIEAALRRESQDQPGKARGGEGTRRLGDLVIDESRCEALMDERPVALTPTEFRLLCKLADRPGEVVSREELAEAVWGYNDYSVGRSLDVHMRRLRGKLRAASKGTPTIVTARGFGYRIEPEEATAGRRAG
jgi:DNA-binding response OmpR family regulator